jgi:hypothetical protein
MNIAYLISAHNDPQQLKRLVEALGDNAWCFIHIDQKSDILPFIEALKCIEGDRIQFIKERTDIRWGTFLQVEYQMALLKAALNYSQDMRRDDAEFHGFDRYITLSGLDFPIRPSRLTSDDTFDPSLEYLMGIDMADAAVADKDTEIYRHARPFFNIPHIGNTANQKLSIICRELLKLLRIHRSLILPNGWHMYKGASWWAITEPLAQHIYNTYTADPSIREFFINSFGPDETLIQTIAFNSPYANRCMKVTGAYPGLYALTPLTYIDYNPIIKILTEDDYPALLESGKLFCRKVVSGKSDKLVEKLLNS